MSNPIPYQLRPSTELPKKGDLVRAKTCHGDWPFRIQKGTLGIMGDKPNPNVEKMVIEFDGDQYDIADMIVAGETQKEFPCTCENGKIDVPSDCGQLLSHCCGGCTESVDCDECGGSGSLLLTFEFCGVEE